MLNICFFFVEFMQPDRLNKRMRRSTKNRRKREAPYIIYPEILVIVDYDGYRLHGGDNVQIKRYFVSFWNGVDLRYKLLKGPRVRISIAGIIISRVSFFLLPLLDIDLLSFPCRSSIRRIFLCFDSRNLVPVRFTKFCWGSNHRTSA